MPACPLPFPRLRPVLAAAGLASAMLAAGPAAADGPPTVAATFTILADLTARVAGPEIEVHGLTPAGAEVHEWELSPRNFTDLEGAEIVFYNGYGLEQWMRQVRAVAGNGAELVPVAEKTGYETIPIRTGELAGAPDPHLWMHPAAAQQYVAVIRDTLAAADPARADSYAENAEALTDEIAQARAEAAALMDCIPEDSRVLITSEAAFLYFADAFGFEHAGIWGSNAEVEGTPEQMMRIVDLVSDRRPAAIFWESTISDRYVRSVSEDTGVPTVGPLYVDSIAAEPDGPRTYTEMLTANAGLLRDTLGVDCETG